MNDNFKKSFGENAIDFSDVSSNIGESFISIGSKALNNILTGNALVGIVQRRIYELYGPEGCGKTTLALESVSSCQKNGGTAMIVDVEHALDPIYCRKLKIDLEKCEVGEPETMEQTFDMIQWGIENNYDLIIVDSVAAMSPLAEIEGDMGDANMGLHARLMGQGMRRITSMLTKKRKTSIIFTNQIRMKIGVMFGCLHGDVKVPLADGRSFTIREIVEKKIKGEVWAYDEINKKFVNSKIIGYHKNGKIKRREDFIHFITNGIETKNGFFGFTVTPEHKILTKEGWKNSKDIKIGDKILSKYTSKINETLKDFLYGVFIGDSYLSPVSKNSVSLILCDNVNENYLKWKLDKLEKFYNFYKNGKNYVITAEYELLKMKKLFDNRNPIIMLKNYSDLSMALWIMDDGHYDHSYGHNRYIISIKRFKNNKRVLDEISELLFDLGFNSSYNLNDGSLSFSVEATNLIASKIAKYIPECMQYKLPQQYKNKYKEFILYNKEEYKECYVNVLKKRISSRRQFKNKIKYDLTIENYSNYLVGNIDNGIIVHNSPETRPGGKALKFFASGAIIDLRDPRGQKTIEGKIETGKIINAKTTKNKLYQPYQTCKIHIDYGKGVNKRKDLLQVLKEKDLCEFTKKTISLEGYKRMSHADFSQMLKEDNELKDYIKELLNR